MQFLKKSILAAASLFIVSATVLSSCAPKSSCDTLVCKNGGTCAADFCSCVTGYDGAQCENKITDRYIGTYAGYTRPRQGQPTHLDTVDVYVSANPLTLSVVRRRDPATIFTGVIQNQNNTIVVNDLINENVRTVVNISIKNATSVNATKVLNLNLVTYLNGLKDNELEFSGELIK
ncbi:MAG TPA: hypothetical protein VL092_12835 [Chitinophagaceae bacterium]|nr:hypothetical protein [Chitinophagaceae bacterium]